MGDLVSLDELRKDRSLQFGGGGGTSEDMEARVKRLEDDHKELRADVKAIRLDTAEIKGKLSNMPSTWQMVGLMVALLGLAFVVIRIAVPA